MSEPLTAHERAIIRQALRAFKLWWNAVHTSSVETDALEIFIDKIEEVRETDI